MQTKLKTLSDQTLLSQTQVAAFKEKSATLELLEYLCEVDRRQAHCIKAYSSLFSYVVGELGFSESQAAERVNAVKLMRHTPAVKAHLANGALTLTSAAQIQRFTQTAKRVDGVKMRADQKQAVIDECLGKSRREVEKVLLGHSSQAAQIVTKEKLRAIAPNRVEVKFSISTQTEAKLNRVRELLGTESLEKVYDRALDALVKQEEKKRGMETTPPITQPPESGMLAVAKPRSSGGCKDKEGQ